LKRRDFITLVGGAAAWPLAARAQSPALPLIGFLNVGSPGAFERYMASFRRGLNDAGYFEGHNLKIEYRWAEGRYDQLPVLASELAQLRVTAFVCVASTVALAAKKADPTTPIVFLLGDDPIRVGLVTSFHRPAGNATGVTLFTLATVTKRIELLHELVPGEAPFAVLVNPNSAMAHVELTEAQAAAQMIGRQVKAVNVGSEREFDRAFTTIADLRAGGLLVTTDPFFTGRSAQLAALATRHKIATNYSLRVFAEAGGLMTYGASMHDAYRQVGQYVARILNGEKPADLPVMQPTKFELVINLKAAKAIALDVPDKLLALADEVIE
jgi:putative ABC transport system substrate-binding protein